MDGSLDLWDILHQQKEPSLSIKVLIQLFIVILIVQLSARKKFSIIFIIAQVCDEPLTSVRCYENGQLVATANNNGCIFLLEFSENLAISAKNDKALLTAVRL